MQFKVNAEFLFRFSTVYVCIMSFFVFLLMVVFRCVQRFFLLLLAIFFFKSFFFYVDLLIFFEIDLWVWLHVPFACVSFSCVYSQENTRVYIHVILPVNKIKFLISNFKTRFPCFTETFICNIFEYCWAWYGVIQQLHPKRNNKWQHTIAKNVQTT